jgi:CubicO group peptidase (beta-lactamase class C family)
MSGELTIGNRVSAAAVNAFFKETRENGCEVHALQVYRDGEVVLRVAPAPYSCGDKREIYSLSKSFASTAVGLACDEGLLSVDDRVVDLFPDKLPENVSDNLAAMRVSHVLSMNTGHETCVMPLICESDDAARAFLSQPVLYEPGTHFVYNTGASCMLAEIIRRVTGCGLFDYINRKLFNPLGIEDAYWNTCAEGVNEGGCGLHVSCDDVLKLGILYLNGGVWNGERLLSEKWVREATAFHSDNSANGSQDWQSGYGYQFWLNARGGYRGDGAFGQLCMVFPESGTVAVVLACNMRDMQKEIDAVLRLLGSHSEPVVGEKPDIPDYKALPPSRDGELKTFEGYYRLEDNPIGLTSLQIATKPYGVALLLGDGRRQQRVPAGNGFFLQGAYEAKYRKPKLLGLMSPGKAELIRVASCCRAEGGELKVLCRHLNSPHTETIHITVADGKLKVFFEMEDRLVPEASRLTGKAC